jgi:bifunctional non-homologous end joining protein LigD
VLRKCGVPMAVVIGEVVVVDERGISDYHKLQEALAQANPDRLTYFVFDLLYLDGFDLRDASLISRKSLLAQLLLSAPEKGCIRFSEHIEGDGKPVFEHACKMHLEGIICKKRDSPYRSLRQDTWLKVKCNQTDTYPILAFVEKLGARPRRIASLYLGRWEDGRLLYAGKAQSGFIAQGGGDYLSDHRCPGEWMTIELMNMAVRFLARELRYEVPPQNMRIDFAHLPALPADRFMIRNAVLLA